ncbi:nucleoside phosphatase family-domain-containing protein [Microdochium trichocladiopsis]|uniref:Nucleoside phosphatase family-domain-containing protein n=1 Tax=Microdochium trichocladiopsis TaxID=1682393 RepID=A0A9P9BX28_9PEZI|nr:nucleoside phosphatase family-domain-containing protein [Microdochium trichocladiopsis]KAH7035671.1 nucleoside phosphatase family-domain-containing protein [Microdochium trichocladiopsis]
MGKDKWRWGVILDAGSSGTRLHVYRWENAAHVIKDADSPEELRRLPELKTKKSWTKKIRPGVSTFGDHPEDIGPEHLKSLIKHAQDVVPLDKQPDTPIFLMATAGMRLLPVVQQRAVLDQICTYFRAETKFSLPDCSSHIQVIPGSTEGLYGWIAANYLLGGFDDPKGHLHGKDHHTYGFLDMGGASAQIAFAPNSTVAAQHPEDLQLVRMRTLDGAPSEHKVFTTTWLGFGMNEARRRYVEELVSEFLIEGEHEVPDPCLPRGLRTTENGDLIEGVTEELELVGTGMWDECQRRTKPLLGLDKPCEEDPCLLNGQHVPSIDFEVNHFVGVSEYWHTTHGVFADGNENIYDFNTYQKKVQEFCSTEWEELVVGLESRKNSPEKEAQEACFKAAWLISVLHEGLGIPRAGIEEAPTPDNDIAKEIGEAAKEKGFLEPFQAADKISGTEVSWTLGKMVLYASGQVPPRSSSNLPVGFGSNVPGVPSDFQYAGSTYNASLIADFDNDWSDAAEDLIDQAKSKTSTAVLVFVIIFLIFGFLFRKRDRRMGLYVKLNSILRPRRKPGSPKKSARGFSAIRNKWFRRGSHNYERVLEEGDVDQFELAETSSDEGENSDSSGDGSRIGRASGLATPKINVGSFDDLRKSLHPGSALDRAGLVVRTESRERLVPQMLNAGRRSRNGSPTRLKSPLMTPLNED